MSALYLLAHSFSRIQKIIQPAEHRIDPLAQGHTKKYDASSNVGVTTLSGYQVGGDTVCLQGRET